MRRSAVRPGRSHFNTPPILGSYVPQACDKAALVRAALTCDARPKEADALVAPTGLAAFAVGFYRCRRESPRICRPDGLGDRHAPDARVLCTSLSSGKWKNSASYGKCAVPKIVGPNATTTAARIVTSGHNRHTACHRAALVRVSARGRTELSATLATTASRLAASPAGRQPRRQQR